MVAEKFQTYGVKITANKYISGSKKHQQNYPLGFYHYPPGRRKLSIPPEQSFLKIYFLPSGTGEDYGIEKLTKTKPARVLVTNFDKILPPLQPLHS